MGIRIPLVAAGALAAGVGLGFMLAGPRAGVPEPAAPAATDPVAELRDELRAMRAALDELLERERLVRPATVTPAAPVPAPSPEREPEPARTPVGDPDEHADLDRLAEEHARLLERVEGILDGLRKLDGDEASAVVRPSLDLLATAPATQDWAALQQIIDGYALGNEARELAIDRMRWKSQAELLRTYGRPTEITDRGVWIYENPVRVRGLPAHVQVYFVLDYAMRLRIY